MTLLSLLASDMDSGISQISGIEAKSNELSASTNVQYYKSMAKSYKKHGSKHKKIIVTDKESGVGNVYIEDGKNVVNITEIGSGTVIIQE